MPSTSLLAQRKKAFTIFAIILVFLGVLYTIWWWMTQRHTEATEDAFTNAHIVSITSRIEGTVASIHGEATQSVTEGTLLITLDPTDAQLALETAKTQLAQTVRNIQQTTAQNQILSANIRNQEALIQKLRIQIQQAQQDSQRRNILLASGSVSQEEVHNAEKNYRALQADLAAAQAELLAKQEQLKANRALTKTAALKEYPTVQEAIVRVKKAYHDVERSHIFSPIAGTIAQRNAEIGQHIETSTPLMRIVDQNVWVDANFKETQIADMRIGQPAVVTIDMYGDSIEYPGTVVGISPGSGGAFAIIPPQNASGNWIKVVQRVPVRIALDPTAISQHPLPIGLSASVRVDVSNTTGSRIAIVAPSKPTPQVEENAPLEKLIDSIIQANS